MRRRPFNFLFVLAMFVPLAVAASGRAQDTSGALSPTRIKLPRGPGSLEGVGENAEANLNQGQASYAVPFALPAGQQGLTPSLGLHYSSSGGASVVGFGWTLGGVPTIERMTARGLPLYTTVDLFATDAGSELTRVTGGSGGNYIYRERFEGSFSRYTWVNATSGGGSAGYWKVESADGRVHYYGARADGTIVPEARLLGAGGSVFAYSLVESVDPFGHRIQYDYVLDGGRPLLTQVSWGFEDLTSNAAARYTASLEYETRPDVLSDAKPGALVRLTQRLVALRIRVSGQQLRRYALSYETTSSAAGLSRLAEVRTFGTDDVTMNPIVFSFGYTRGLDLTCSASSSSCPRPYRRTVGSVGVDFRGGNADFIDMNGDSIPDVLDTTGGVHTIHLQTFSTTMAPSFLPPIVSTMVGSGSAMLSAPEVKLVDLDGDGRSDLVDGANARVIRNGGATGDWRAAELLDTHLPSMGLDGDLRFLDVDYDRQIDLIHLESAGAWYYRNLGSGIFSTSATIVTGLGRGFTTDGLELADMNGDGMPDLAQFQPPGDLWYFPNLGRGEFGAAIVVNGVPVGWDSATTDLVDISGDGLTDLVRVVGATVEFVLNRDSISLGAKTTLAGSMVTGDLPERFADTSVRYVDMNANGTTDVVYVSASGAVEFVELFSERPNLLTRVDNAIGKQIFLQYGTVAEHMARDGGTGAASGWAQTPPHPMVVLDAITITDSRTGVPQLQQIQYRSGYWDSIEHQFRGFEYVRVTSPGDAHAETREILHSFDVGVTDRYHHGLPTRVETRSDARTLSITSTEWTDCSMSQATAVGSLLVRWVCSPRNYTDVVEGLGAAETVRTEEDYQYDGYGNKIASHKLGVISRGGQACAACTRDTSAIQGEPCGQICVGDEIHELVDFIAPGSATSGRWMLRLQYRKRTMGIETSSEVAEERTYYDGADLVGLPLATVNRGVVHRVEERRVAGVDAWRSSQRFVTDAHGNVTSSMDAGGHTRSFSFDQAGLLVTAEQANFDGPGHAPYALRMDVSYDPVTEQISGSTRWMRVEGGSVLSAPRTTSYRYDALGRISAIISPGDSASMPTVEFGYELADPVSRIVTRRRSVSGAATTDLESVECFDGLGRKFQDRVRVADGLYLASGNVGYDARGNVSRSYQSFVAATGTCDVVLPGSGTRYSETYHDAQGRTTRVICSDVTENGSLSEERVVYAPLAVESWDAEDNDSSSPYAGTPTRAFSDGLGRFLRQERTLNGDSTPLALSVTYDAQGRLRSLTDSNGNEQIQVYDLLDRVVETLLPDSGRSIYSFDDVDNVVSRRDARGAQTNHAYDEANRIVATWDAARPTESMVSYRYDGDCTGGSAACSNGEGLLVETTHPLLDAQVGRERIARDTRGREVATVVERGSRTYSFGTAFDNADRATSRTYPGGITVAFTLDGAGRLTGVPGYVNFISYDPRGPLARVELANGVTSTQSHDPRLRLLSLNTVLPNDGGDAQALTYEWDRVGNLRRVHDMRVVDSDAPTEEVSYQYDSLYRLTGALLDANRPSAEAIEYAYDRVDNLTSIASSLGAASAAHAGNLRHGENGAGPHAVTHVGGDLYSYDAAGQVTERLGITHTWDHLGRLIASRNTQTNELLTETAYGPDWARAEQAGSGHASEYVAPDFEVRDGIGTIFVRRGDTTLARIEVSSLTKDEMPDGNGDGVVSAADAWLRQAESAGLEGVTLGGAVVPSGPQTSVQVMLEASSKRLLLGADGASITFEHADHLGTVSAETDEAGVVTRRLQTYPYGTPRYVDGTSWSPHSYTSMERDANTGLQLHGARWLDTRAGQWTRPDPAYAVLGKHSLEHALEAASPYSYVLGRVTDSVDRAGQDVIALHGGGSSGFPGGVVPLAQRVQRVWNSLHPAFPATILRAQQMSYQNRANTPWYATSNNPWNGTRFAERERHYGGEGSARILVGFSIGGDAALRAGYSEGRMWDLRVVAGARVEANFVDLVERAAATSHQFVLVALRGDTNIANDVPEGTPNWLNPGPAFGDRSYEAVVRAITARYGSLEAFYQAHPNVSIQEAEGAHMGGGQRASTLNAAERGIRELTARGSP